MTITIAASGDAAQAVEAVVPTLVSDLVASGITAQNPTLWGPDAEDESAKRLGWTEAVVVSTPLLDAPPPVRFYAPGSWGPNAIHQIVAPHAWRLPFERAWRGSLNTPSG